MTGGKLSSVLLSFRRIRKGSLSVQPKTSEQEKNSCGEKD